MADRRRILNAGIAPVAAALLVASFGVPRGAPAGALDVLPSPALIIEMDASGVGERIALGSFTFGVEGAPGAAAGAGGGAGKVSVHDISVTKHLDPASPKLLEACAKGSHLAAVQIRLCGTGGCTGPYLQYELKNVMITSYQISGAGGESMPTESLSLNFEEVKVTYVEQDERLELRRRGRWWLAEGPF